MGCFSFGAAPKRKVAEHRTPEHTASLHSAATTAPSAGGGGALAAALLKAAPPPPPPGGSAAVAPTSAFGGTPMPLPAPSSAVSARSPASAELLPALKTLSRSASAGWAHSSSAAAADAAQKRSLQRNRSALSSGSVAEPLQQDAAAAAPPPVTRSSRRKPAGLRGFSLAELEVITRGFDATGYLGGGGFGSVYKGFIDSADGHSEPVAVKVLNTAGFQARPPVKDTPQLPLWPSSLPPSPFSLHGPPSGEKEWTTEVSFLGHLHHPNLVNLIGFCADGEQRLLVYEFMPNRSLEHALFRRAPGDTPLAWSQRMRIALGAANGLTYLHDEAEAPVIYRDFKTSNILLDRRWEARLSDFGLARSGPEGDKSHWAEPYLENPKKLYRIMDPELGGRYSVRGAQMAAALIKLCLNKRAKQRPRMADVVEALRPIQGLHDMAGFTVEDLNADLRNASMRSTPPALSSGPSTPRPPPSPSGRVPSASLTPATGVVT
eukprot:SM000016S01897  [mRNA]  locus=s16:473256:475566:- [translate_table: standard]